ncbi:MAG TPA: ParB/RepB/Spo0J family partition protein [Pirellulales bacterium]|nr:ParB/RepB/Spo0J family partition protein [Pirellulales bacterium]
MSKEKRLGRGLEALLGRPFGSAPELEPDNWHQPAAGGTAALGGGLVMLSVYEIDSNPYQPRREFNPTEIDELAESITAHGVIQPIVVRKQGERYQLIAGERRLRASIKAGLPEIPAQVRDADDRQINEIAIVENLQRKDLNALEKAASFQQYLQRYQCTQEELAKRLHIDRSTIANLIRLMELPDQVQAALRSGTITPGHARALLPLGDEQEQIKVCQRIQAEGLSVRAIEELVQETIHAVDSPSFQVVSPEDQESAAPPRKKTKNEQIAALENELRAAVGSKVQIRQTASGRGKIILAFHSVEEFERLRAHLNGSRAARVG